jgi:hypothetical protein
VPLRGDLGHHAPRHRVGRLAADRERVARAQDAVHGLVVVHAAEQVDPTTFDPSRPKKDADDPFAEAQKPAAQATPPADDDPFGEPSTPAADDPFGEPVTEGADDFFG